MTPDQVRARMQRDGVSHTLTAFQGPSFAPTNRAMSEGISSGDDQWLALVPLLSTSGSAEMGEGLIMLLAEALPRSTNLLPRPARPRSSAGRYNCGR